MAIAPKPAKHQALAMDTWWWVPVIADIYTPTADEINDGLNLTCYMTGDQEGPGSETERVTLPRLACERETEEALGQTTISMPDRTFVWDPQAEPSHTDKKAWEAFKSGAKGHYVQRENVDQFVTDPDDQSEVHEGQYVNVYTASVAKAMPTKTSTDAAGIYAFTTAVGLTGTAMNVKVAA